MNKRNQSSAALTAAAQTIKDSVSALDVADALGWEVKHGRCRCPIHGGQNFNCRLYPGDRGYMCWVCKSAGDVISLVRNSDHGMSFRDAVAWFNNTFNLGIDIDSPLSAEAVKQVKMAQRKRAMDRELAEWKDQMMFNMALTADDIVRRLEDVRDEKRPRTYGDWDYDFCCAVKLLPEARRFSDDIMMECIKDRKK